MSQGSLANAPVQKQKLNVYTIMLVIAFLALVVGAIFLYLELMRFGKSDWWNTSAAQVTRIDSPATVASGNPRLAA